MDSSRSGLLSTLLMTLPLIVVPAIALLRPPGHPPGVSTATLDASDESDADDDFLSDFSDLETGTRDGQKSSERKSNNKDSEFDGIFAPEEPMQPSKPPKLDSQREKVGKNKSKPREEADPFMTSDPPSMTDDSADETPTKASGPTADQIVEQLNAQGALKTMWFEAGPKSPVGFAVFFRGSTELMRYRFEAVGQTRDECARSVLKQVTHWQSQQADHGQ